MIDIKIILFSNIACIKSDFKANIAIFYILQRNDRIYAIYKNILI